jgi:hypothetical protein
MAPHSVATNDYWDIDPRKLDRERESDEASMVKGNPTIPARSASNVNSNNMTASRTTSFSSAQPAKQASHRGKGSQGKSSKSSKSSSSDTEALDAERTIELNFGGVLNASNEATQPTQLLDS